MNKQLSLPLIHNKLKEVKTHKREFLEKMDAMPWEQLYALVKPFYYEGVRGNKPYVLELMISEFFPFSYLIVSETLYLWVSLPANIVLYTYISVLSVKSAAQNNNIITSYDFR